MARDQDPVERAHGGGEVVPVAGIDDLLDHRVDRRIVRAGEVERAFRFHRPRAPAPDLLGARRQRRRQAAGDHVEIPALAALLELGVVDAAQADVDADGLGGAFVGERHPLDLVGGRADDGAKQDLEGELLATLHHPAVLDRIARLGQLGDGRLEHGAVAARTVRHRRRVGALHDVRQDRPGEGRQQFALPVGRRPAERGQFGRVLPVGAGAAEPVREQVRVDPLEIEQHGQRLAHAPVGEDVAARVEEEAEEAVRAAGHEGRPDHLAIVDGGKVVGRFPPDGVAFDIDVEHALLEGLETRGGVAEILDRDRLVIGEAAHRRYVSAPIVGVAAVGDAGAGLDALDQIGAAADRRLKRRFAEGFHIDGVPGQHRRQGDDQRKLAVGVLVEVEPDGAVAGLLDILYTRRAPVEGRAALLGEKLVGEDDVLGRHRNPVGPARVLIERELDPGAFLVGLHLFRQQPVHGERLVARAQQQRFIDQVAEHRVPDAARRGAHRLEHERVQAVEGADHAIGDRSVPGGVGIGVGKVLVIGRQGRLAMHGDAVSGFGQGRRDQQRERGGGGNQGGDNRRAWQGTAPLDGIRIGRQHARTGAIFKAPGTGLESGRWNVYQRSGRASRSSRICRPRLGRAGGQTRQ